MATMEGPLSKWTNVMKGWQYRWFVLDENSGLLSYYTSKEKMMRGSRRGCVRLKGAVIGIDDEDDSTFTITVDQKTFHFQARDADEKEKWIEALDNTIMRHGQPIAYWDGKPSNSMVEFDRKLAETDAYLGILIEQVKALGIKINQCEDEEAKQKYNVIKVTAEAMIESIKQAIITMQISKQSLRSSSPVLNGHAYEAVPSENGDHNESDHMISDPLSSLSRSTECIEKTELSVDEILLRAPSSTSMPNLAIPKGLELGASAPNATIPANRSSQPISIRGSSADVEPGSIPATSYSSSEDEDFFDAEDDDPDGSSGNNRGSNKNKSTVENDANEEEIPPHPQVIKSEDDFYDELYDDTSEDALDSLDQHGSVITYLLSQVRIGMDLTKIVLPTFILEKRSLLEMYSDFLAHPDFFVRIADFKSPHDRFIQAVRWYMSAFHAGRKSSVAKKPYNPIIGETFICHYDVPNEPPEGEPVGEGPVPWATKNNVGLICEQVSHHPPISAFYAEHYNKRISLDGYIWTKSKFLGLSIGVHMIGQAVISVLDYDEEYIITFPNGYGRSILTVPWVEMGGKVSVTCPKTGYYANIEFLTKPFYGGKKDKIRGELYSPTEKKPFCNIEGEWNGVMYAKHTSGLNEVFVDTKNTPIVKKRVQPIDKQGEFESRRLWRDVTYNLKHHYLDEATAAKHRLEQRQREEAKERKERGAKWETKLFHEVGEHWVFDSPLGKRLAQDKARKAKEEEMKNLQTETATETAEKPAENQPPRQESSPPDTADEDSWQEAETELTSATPSSDSTQNHKEDTTDLKPIQQNQNLL